MHFWVLRCVEMEMKQMPDPEGTGIQGESNESLVFRDVWHLIIKKSIYIVWRAKYHEDFKWLLWFRFRVASEGLFQERYVLKGQIASRRHYRLQFETLPTHVGYRFFHGTHESLVAHIHDLPHSSNLPKWCEWWYLFYYMLWEHTNTKYPDRHFSMLNPDCPHDPSIVQGFCEV